jgi:glutamate synthase domain-containing protein 2
VAGVAALTLVGATVAGVAISAAAAAVTVRLVGRTLVRQQVARLLHRLSTDPYHENLWETVTGLRRVGVQATLETELRAAVGHPPLRPFGRFRRFPGFDELLFDPAQLARLPAPEDRPVDTSVVLGPRAARPLRLAIPLLITGMGYAIALSPEAKCALARGAALAGTATNTGMGPLLPEERRLARYLIVQYNRASWNKDPDILRQADMLELQFGQGAWGGSGLPVPAEHLPPRLRRLLGLGPGSGQAWVHSRMPGVERPGDLAALVAELRAVTGGIPIGIKLAAGDRLEWDLEVALRAGVDCVTLDGAEGGTHGAPPILADDFGLPTFVALCRASRFLAACPAGERPSLIVSGGLFTPGHFLKALALGADAVAIGTIALFAAAFDQTPKAVPWEPPLSLFWYGRPAARRLDVDKAAHSLARFLRAATEEMAMAARALGKTALAAVDRGDLCALEPWVAGLAGVRLCWRPRPVPGPGEGPGLQAGLDQLLRELGTAKGVLLRLHDRIAGGRSGP